MPDSDLDQLARDIDAGFVTWRDIEPRRDSADPEGEARDITRQGAEAALCLLVNGEGRVIR